MAALPGPKPRRSLALARKDLVYERQSGPAIDCGAGQDPNWGFFESAKTVPILPGYYKSGAYGIRIENLVSVVETPKQDGEERDMLGFETLTLAPIDRALVEPALLNEAEVAWLDGYHARVCEVLTPLVDAQTAAWLKTATRPLAS